MKARTLLYHIQSSLLQNGGARDLLHNKMVNPSNGPAAMTWFNMFCLDCYYGSMYELVTDDHTCSQVVRFESLDSMNNLVTPGHRCDGYHGSVDVLVVLQFGGRWNFSRTSGQNGTF